LLWAILTGEWQVTAASGESRGFRAGELILLEDTEGQGHSSRLLEDGSLAPSYGWVRDRNFIAARFDLRLGRRRPG
jgi:hypothetical protein